MDLRLHSLRITMPKTRGASKPAAPAAAATVATVRANPQPVAADDLSHEDFEAKYNNKEVVNRLKGDKFQTGLKHNLIQCYIEHEDSIRKYVAKKANEHGGMWQERAVRYMIKHCSESKTWHDNNEIVQIPRLAILLKNMLREGSKMSRELTASGAAGAKVLERQSNAAGNMWWQEPVVRAFFTKRTKKETLSKKDSVITTAVTPQQLHEAGTIISSGPLDPALLDPAAVQTVLRRTPILPVLDTTTDGGVADLADVFVQQESAMATAGSKRKRGANLKQSEDKTAGAGQRTAMSAAQASGMALLLDKSAQGNLELLKYTNFNSTLQQCIAWALQHLPKKVAGPLIRAVASLPRGIVEGDKGTQDKRMQSAVVCARVIPQLAKIYPSDPAQQVQALREILGKDSALGSSFAAATEAPDSDECAAADL